MRWHSYFISLVYCIFGVLGGTPDPENFCQKVYWATLLYKQVTVHSHVNHSADWHGGCTFCPECISPIAVGDSKWRDTLLFAGYL